MKIFNNLNHWCFILAVCFNLSFVSVQAQTKILWAYGDNFGGYENNGIGQQTDIKILSHWYNGPGDLWWINGYAGTNRLSDYYAQGYGVQLIVWLGPGAFGSGENSSMNYAIGNVVKGNDGTEYFFYEDLERLITIFKGRGPVYGPLSVVLFSEVETHSSQSNREYWDKLQRSYLDAARIIRNNYPYAEVGLGFGGYAWSGSSLSHTRSDIAFWEPSINASDFVCTQSMQAANNWKQNTFQIRNAVKQLGAYGKPVMISHFKLWTEPGNLSELGPRQAKPAFINFMDDVFTEESLAALYADGLRMFVFMDDEYIRDRTGRNYEAVTIGGVDYPAIQNYDDVAFRQARDFINQHNETDPVMRLDPAPAPEPETRQLLLNYSFDADREFSPDIHSQANFSAGDLTFPDENVSFQIYTEDIDPHGTGNGKWIRDTGYLSPNINATSVKEAVDPLNTSKKNDYVTFTVTPNSGQTLSLSWLSFDMQMRTGSNVSDPPVLNFCAAVFYKKGDYMFRIGNTFKVSAQASGSTSGWMNCPVDFSKVNFNRNEVVEFRIYFWRENEGITGLHSRWLEIDNIRLYGSSESTGIGEVKDNNQYQIYPNPAKNVVYVNGISNFDVQVLDLTGKVIQKKHITNNGISIETLNPGVYFFRITKDGKVHILRFIKE